MINTDKKTIEYFLNRAVENVYPTPKLLEKKLLSGEKLTIYAGIDPTGELHLGHATVFRKLSKLHEMGHKIIVLVGSFTAKIGDPTGKFSTRKQLTDEDIKKNMIDYKEQMSSFFNFNDKKNPIEIKYNGDWLSKMSFEDVVNLASHFTVQQMAERDMFANRLKEGKPIHLHEFLYPLMQGYDSVFLNVDLEIGGNDQTFNMLAGRTLLREMKGKEKMVMTLKLLTDSSGKKMGKTDNNSVVLSNTANEMFGKVMSWSDEMIVNAFDVLTDLNEKEIEKISKEIKKGANPREFKMKLAYEVVRLYKNESGAKEAMENFINVFTNKAKPTDIETVSVKSKNIIEALVEAKMVTSKTEARRVIDQKGLKVGDVVITDYNFELPKGISFVQKGKRHFLNIKVG